MRKYNLQKNFLQYHIFFPIEYALVALGYYKEIFKIYILWSIPIMLVWSITSEIFIQTISEFNTYFLNLELLFFVIFSILTLRKLTDVKVDVSFTAFPIFWISCGLLIFSVANYISL